MENMRDSSIERDVGIRIHSLDCAEEGAPSRAKNRLHALHVMPIRPSISSPTFVTDEFLVRASYSARYLSR